MLEFVSEDPSVPGNRLLLKEHGFGPGPRLEEGRATDGRVGGLLHFAFAQDEFGSFVQGAQVVAWHHSFGRLTVCRSVSTCSISSPPGVAYG